MGIEEIKKHKLSLREVLNKLDIKGDVSSVTVPPNQAGKTIEEKYLIVIERKDNYGKSNA